MSSEYLGNLTWFALDVHQLLGSEDVDRMTASEFGQYMLLLCHAWRFGKEATLPNDPQYLAKLARVDQVSELVMSKFHVNGDGRLHNDRLHDEWKRVDSRQKRNVENGKKGGAPSHKGNQVSDLSTPATPKGIHSTVQYNTSIEKNQEAEGAEDEDKNPEAALKQARRYYSKKVQGRNAGILNAQQILRWNQLVADHGRHDVVMAVQYWVDANLGRLRNSPQRGLYMFLTVAGQWLEVVREELEGSGS